MTLREMLENYKGIIIKIGAKDGSSWMYCDRCSDRTIQILDRMSDEIELELKNTIEKKTFALAGTRLTQIERRVAKSVLEDAQSRLADYTRLLDREVVETYATVDCPSIHESMIDIRAIIVEGREVGKFWTLSEYANYGIH